MSAVMENDENTHGEQCGKQRENQRQHVGDFKAAVGQIPHHKIGDHTVDDLPDAFSDVGLLVLGDGFTPVTGLISRGGVGRGSFYTQVIYPCK